MKPTGTNDLDASALGNVTDLSLVFPKKVFPMKLLLPFYIL